MPCTYYLPGEEEAIRSREYHIQVEALTQLLCSACQGLENTGSNMLRSGGPLGDWWIEHKNKDKRRLEMELQEKEKAKKNAIKDKERKIAKLEKELKELKKK